MRTYTHNLDEIEGSNCVKFVILTLSLPKFMTHAIALNGNRCFLIGQMIKIEHPGESLRLNVGCGLGVYPSDTYFWKKNHYF